MTRKQLYIELILLIISIICIILGYTFQFLNASSSLIPIFFGLSFIIGGFEKAKEGVIKTIENKSLNVEILMILAALGAFIVGDYAEGAILIMIFSISGVLESYATSKSEKALTNLLKLAPQKAIKLINDQEIEVLIEDLHVGDVVIVKVGDQVPVDGVIIKGQTSLDQAAITGEFVPVIRSEHDSVYAGSMNIESTIIVQTTKDPKDSVVQKIVDFVKRAQTEKTASQSFIDHFETWYVYVVIALALCLMFIPPIFNIWTKSYAFNRGVIVLVVGSPCALVASITPAMLSALSNGARKRILIKGGTPLDTMVNVKAIMLDKTGTLTSGVPHVVNIFISPNEDKELGLKVLYTLEKQSTHPLAKAIIDHLNPSFLLDDIITQEKSGHGMEANINGHLWQVGRFDSIIDSNVSEKFEYCNSLGHSYVQIIKDGIMIGFVALMDTIRKQAPDVIFKLKKMGIKTVLLTGDHKFTAHAIAKEIGIDDVLSDLLPEDKVKHVTFYQEKYGRVMMVGDGINDAPALAISDVSVAMGSATDVSLETADIVIMNDDLHNIPKLINLAKRTRIITLQNIIFSVSVITLLLISNIFGFIELPLGVVAHEGSTILVILNSLRLLFK